VELLMDEFNEYMKVVLANSFAFYLKAHNFHWNVEGANFNDHHNFLGKLYTEVWEAVDEIAEHIRTLDVYVPGSFVRFHELSEIEDEVNVLHAQDMFLKLEEDNKTLIASLKKAQKMADRVDAVVISNFLQDRIDIHEKHGWMMRAITKR